MKKNRVLLIGPDTKSKGGIAAVINNLYNSASGFSFEYLKFSVNKDQTKIKKIIFFIPNIIQYAFVLLLGRIKIVHANPSENWGFYRYIPYFLVGKIFRKKIIFHMHGGRFDIFFLSQSNFKRNIIVCILNSCDAIICLSASWQKKLIEFGIKKTFIVSNTIPVQLSNLYSNDSKVITFIGFIEVKKGIFDLLKAFKESKLCEAYHLFVCGSGEESQLKEEILQLGIENSVVFHGWINELKKDEILRKTKVLALPSYAEGLPMVLLEAMSYGIPVISTPVGGIPELVYNNVNGFLISPGDISELASALNNLVSNDELCKKFSENNYSKIKQQYSMNYALEQLSSIYNEILNH